MRAHGALVWLTVSTFSLMADGCGTDVAALPVPQIIDAGTPEEVTPRPSPPAPEPALQIDLDVAPAAVVLAPGESKTVAITVAGAGAEVVDLGIDNVPAGVSALIDPLLSTGNATLTLTAGPVATPGKFQPSVRARAANAYARASVSVEIVAPAPAFDVVVAPDSIAVTPGEVVGLALSVVRRGGFSGALSVSVPSLPTGFEAATFTIPPTATAGVLNVRTNQLLPPETTATLAIRVSSESLGEKIVQATIAVSPRPGTLELGFGQAGSIYNPGDVPLDGKFVIDDNGWIRFSGAYGADHIQHTFGLTHLLWNGAFFSNQWTTFTDANGFEMIGKIGGMAKVDAGRYMLAGTLYSEPSMTVAALGAVPIRGTFQPCGLPGLPSSIDGVVGFVATYYSPWAAIVVGSCGGGGFHLVRWRSDGTLDPNFGTSGRAAFDSPIDRVKIATTPSESYVYVAGARVDRTGMIVSLVAEWSGALASFYGSGGSVEIPAPADGIQALYVYPDGRVLVAFIKTDATSILRLTASGAIDGTFGTSGIAALGLRSVRTIVRQADGKILVGGVGASYGPAIVRISSDGLIDTSFGLEGTASFVSNASLQAIRAAYGRITAVSVDTGGLYVSHLWQ